MLSSLPVCTNYPVVDEPAICNDLAIQQWRQHYGYTGSDLNVGGNISVGEGVSGSFTMNGGNCKAIGNLYTDSGSYVHIAGGTFSFF